MIVTCAKCDTQFQLEEARIPESGIRVRCSVCKHAFFVEHADALGEPSRDPITRVVEDVLDAEGAELPEATQDLEVADRQTPAPPGSRAEAREDESWEFSDGGRLSDAAGRDRFRQSSDAAGRDRFRQSFDAACSAVDDLLGSPGLDPEPPSFPEPAPAEAVSPPPDFFSAPVEPEEEEVVSAPTAEDELEAPAPTPELGPPEDDAPVALADDPWEIPAWSDGEVRVDPPSSEPAVPAAPEEDLELELARDGEKLADPDFDPFADGLPGDAEPLEGELAPADGPDLDGVGALEARPLAAPAGAAPLAAGPAPLLGRAALPELAPRRGVLAGSARAVGAVGWGVVAILAGVAFFASAAPRARPGVAAGAQALAGFEATGIEGRWVENAIAGPLYVVRGELHNAGPDPKAPGARLVVRLLDAAGAPLDVAAASLAPPAPAEWLREAHPRQLRDLRESGARKLAQTPIAPGARIPFEAVVESLPGSARRFDLAVAPTDTPGPGDS